MTEYKLNPTKIVDDLKVPTMISFLDLARWVAAGMVVVGHLRNPMFFGYNNLVPADRTLFVKFWYFITGWHAEAVIVFFVLSGLLVGGVGSARIANNTFRSRDFAIDRVSRLYVAFLPALFLGFGLDMIGSHFFASVGFWDHTQTQIALKINSAPFETMLSMETLLGNMFMLQTFFTQSLGSNQPLWTISAEFWFYAVFLLLALMVPKNKNTHRLVASVVFFVILIALGSKFIILLGLWLIGVVIAYIPKIFTPNVILSIGLFLGVLVVTRLYQGIFDENALLRMLKNYAVALSFGIVILSMRGREYKSLVYLAPFNRFMADYSYSLYLLHFPLMLFVLAMFHASGMFPNIQTGYSPTDSIGVLLYIFVIITVYSVAWIFSRLTEAKTHIVRKKLKAIFLNNP